MTREIATPINEASVEPLKFAPLSWVLDTSDPMYTTEIANLVEAERSTPFEVTKDLSLRAKILDACGFTCTFCHNEGTPVAIDNMGTNVVFKETAGRSGRVSVFSATNGVDFLPGRMDPEDPAFVNSLASLKDAIGVNELHLTGGEPTLHPNLVGIVRAARKSGYRVGITSNGEKGAAKIKECADEGLEKINFSIFGTSAEELASVQHEKYQDRDLANRKIEALQQSIEAAADSGISVGANIVMSDISHEARVQRLLTEFDHRLSIRILPDLSETQTSALAIYTMLAGMNAKPLITSIEAGSSNARVKYVLPGGRLISFKQIRPTRLDECETCEFNNPEDCKEGYYGTRLYIDKAGNYKVGVCLQRMDLVLGVDDFTDSDLCKQVVKLREDEYTFMQQQYKKG